MLSLIEVTCPHCGVQGQILMPPLGAIIVGPCPECGEMVTIFCGRVLPLDKEVMEHGTQEERRTHLLEALGGFLEDRVDRLIAGASRTQTSEDEAPDPAANDHLFDDIEEELAFSDQRNIRPMAERPEAPITNDEISSFRDVDLRLLDNAEYFRAVFK